MWDRIPRFASLRAERIMRPRLDSCSDGFAGFREWLKLVEIRELSTDQGGCMRTLLRNHDCRTAGGYRRVFDGHAPKRWPCNIYLRLFRRRQRLW